MELSIYEHKAQYYETDQMGIIHHSNYIRWFEEARVNLMEQLGLGYDIMEQEGIISPVLSVQCDYKSMTHFNDVVLIQAKVLEYTGVKLTISYVVSDKKTSEVRCTGESKHCFLNKESRPISLKRSHPKFDKLIADYKEMYS